MWFLGSVSVTILVEFWRRFIPQNPPSLRRDSSKKKPGCDFFFHLLDAGHLFGGCFPRWIGMPRLRVVRCAWETTAMKWFEKNWVQGGRVDRIRVVSHGCLWFYDILCNVVFFCLDLFGEVLFGVLGKQTFFLKSSALLLLEKTIAVFVFQTSSWGGVTGAGDLVVPWATKNIPKLPGLGFDFVHPRKRTAGTQTWRFGSDDFPF